MFFNVITKYRSSKCKQWLKPSQTYYLAPTDPKKTRKHVHNHKALFFPRSILDN